MKKLSAILMITLLIIVLFPTGALAATHTLVSGDSLNLSTGVVTHSDLTTTTLSPWASGDNVIIQTGSAVTLTGTAPTGIGVICEESVTLTLNNAEITAAAALIFNGNGNTLMLTGVNAISSTNRRNAGIRVEGGDSLVITGEGSLTAQSSGDHSGAGIGGSQNQKGGSITITNTNVTATSGWGAAAIGGGYGFDLGNGNNGTVTIINSTVNATAGTYTDTIGAAGIGGGYNGDGGTITITNSTVTARGYYYGSGIGGGYSPSTIRSGNIQIDGNSSVRAYGGEYGAAIGTRWLCDSIEIRDSTVYAEAGRLSPGIGGDGGTIDIISSTIEATGGDHAAAIGNGRFATLGTSISIEDSNVTATGYYGAGIGAGLLCTGLTEIDIANNSTIIATATGEYGAGIGVGKSCGDAVINITDSNVTATAVERSAGIGSCYGSGDSEINITNSTVTAYGHTAAGIGNGSGLLNTSSSYCGTADISITGSNITAYGGGHGAGIGNGACGGAVDIEIDDSIVTAHGGVIGAGIGNTSHSDAVTITITNSSVVAIASGTNNSAGIGSSHNSTVDSITITDSNVSATGGSQGGAGIGGGYSQSGGDIELSGGLVYAAGYNGAADIGPGSNGSGGTLEISGTGAVILENDNSLSPTLPNNHRHKTTLDAEYPMQFIDNSGVYSVYGIDVDSSWIWADGGYFLLIDLAYNSNGGSGTVPETICGNHNRNLTTTIEDGSSLSYAGYQFNGWNTDTNGNGTSYAVGSEHTFTADTVLYAQWASSLYTLTYSANGGSGTLAGPVEQAAGTTTTVASGNALSRTNYQFSGWNTEANGSGTAYAAGSTFTFNSNTTLYAQWIAQPVIYSNISDGTIYVGGRINLWPNIPGGTWSWDKSYLESVGKSGNTLTFKGLKTGQVTVYYTVEGQTATYVVTIKASALPNTGQSYTIIGIFTLLGLLTFIGCRIFFGKRRAYILSES